MRSIFLFFCFVAFLASFRAFSVSAAAEGDKQLKVSLAKEFELLGEEAFGAALNVIRFYDERTNPIPPVCNGRLTLTSGTAITSSNVTAATTVYFTPFNGNKITLFNGTLWQRVTFSETSVAVPSTTTTPFDVFAYSNAGTLALEAVSWTNDTTRAIPLGSMDGIVTKADPTRRYLGTARTTSVSGQTEDSASRRLLWNMCNRALRTLTALPSTDSWNYTIATWRAANADTTIGATRVEFILGQSIEPVKLQCFNPLVLNSLATIDASVGIGISSTSANSADLFGGKSTPTYTSQRHAFYAGYPGTGYFYGQWLENSVANSTTTWYGYSAGYRQSGLFGEVWD